MGRYLAGRGHRRIVFLSHYHGLDWSKRRLEGLQESFCGYPAPAEVIPVVSDGTSYNEENIRSLDRRYNEQISVPFAEFWARIGGAFLDAAQARDGMTGLIRGFLGGEITREQLELLFLRALERSDATAWVCANDDTALAALARLSQRGAGPPVALAGFDDSHRAFLAKLTSYNFDAAAVAHAAIRHLLFPARPPRGEGGPRVEAAEGFVVPRESA